MNMIVSNELNSSFYLKFNFAVTHKQFFNFFLTFNFFFVLRHRCLRLSFSRLLDVGVQAVPPGLPASLAPC